MNNVIQILISANDAASAVINGVTNKLDGVSSKMMRVGAQITLATAAITAGLFAAGNAALKFDESMTNVGAVLGKNTEQMAALSQEILKIGGASRAGPQAVAQAFYDIVGGVSDATQHIPILSAAIDTAEAGAADLTATTSALVSIMNAYKFSAEDATRVSDILTRTVAVGVGTMDDFAAAFPAVTTLAAQAGISLEEVGASMAFMTQRGLTASIASTSLRQAIVALLNPNKDMTDALAAAGLQSGETALRTLGLAGTFQKLAQASGGSIEALTGAVGSVEALQAAMALGDAGFTQYFTDFNNGLEGATEAARAIQRESPAFQMDLLKAAMSELAITIGGAILPAMNRLLGIITPIIRAVSEWLREHPRLTTALVAFAAALSALGPLLIVGGAALKGLALAQTGLNTVLGVGPALLGALLSPIGLLVAGLALLATVLGVDVLGGFEQIALVVRMFTTLLRETGSVFEALQIMFADGNGSKLVAGILESFGMAREQAQALGDTINRVATQIIAAVEGIGKVLSGDWAGGFQQMTGAGIPPGIAKTIADITDGIRGILTTAQSVFSNLDLYAAYYFEKIWIAVKPVLQPILDWFTGTGANSLGGAVVSAQDFLGDLVDTFEGLWIFIQPMVQPILDWFTGSGVNSLRGSIDLVIGTIGDLRNGLVRLWSQVQPFLQPLLDMITDIVNSAADSIEMLRRMGGGDAQRALPWESAPGVAADVSQQFTMAGSGGGGRTFGPTAGGKPLGQQFAGSFGIGNAVNPFAAPFYQEGAQQQSDRAAQEQAAWDAYYRGGMANLPFAPRDSGGRGYAGVPVAIGTGAQPEVFVPDSAGSFYPRGEGMPGTGGDSGITVMPGAIVIYESNDPEQTERAVLMALMRLKQNA